MGTGTWVMVGIGAWMLLSLPVGLLIGAMVRSSRRAPQRPGPSAATRRALAGSGHTPVTVPGQTRAACTRRNRIASLVD